MNNKVTLNFATAPSWGVSENGLFRASNIDALVMYSNAVTPTIESGTYPNVDTDKASTDSFYLPEGLGDFSTHITLGSTIIRQDVKKIKPIRLPQAILGQGLVILSLNDTFEQYFINSIVIRTGSGYLRYGLASWTANQATNPLTDGNQSVLSALWSFFDITKKG
jgi:hypothetical protein